MKAGWKSTEFWATVAAALIGALIATGAVEGTPWAKVAGVAGVALASLGYSVSRGIAKGGNGK